MSKLLLYNSLKRDLEAISGVQHVDLWNNQIERENVENPFLYPAIFIQFIPSEYRDKGKNGLTQEYDLIVRLHICFESYLDTDTSILTLTDTVFQTVQTKQYGYFGKLLRRNEEQDFDHNNVQDYIQDYKTLGHDTVTVNTTTATLTQVLNTTLNTPDEI